MRLFRCTKPVVAAVQGAAVGGGLGLALVGDFRVASPESRFTANFNRLGFHPGFGLSITLPRVVGEQKAALLFYTGRRIGGRRRTRSAWSTCWCRRRRCARPPWPGGRDRAIRPARRRIDPPHPAPRPGRRDRGSTDHELAEQQQHFDTEDFKEGVKAMAERRVPAFQGR